MSVRCPKCGGPGVLLFIHIACDACDKREIPTGLFVGYALDRKRTPGSSDYVFKTKEDAETWRSNAGWDEFPIRRVVLLSDSVFSCDLFFSSLVIKIAVISKLYPDKATLDEAMIDGSVDKGSVDKGAVDLAYFCDDDAE